MQPPWTTIIDYNDKPLFVCWETTKACQLACRHCRATAQKKRQDTELDTAAGIDLIDQLTEFGQPYPALLFTGGDPLMRTDLSILLEHARKKGVYTAVAASVTPILTQDQFALLRALGVEIVSVSLDGATPLLHDRIRDIPGTWNSTLRAVEDSRSQDLRVQVNTTVMRSNLRDLADIFHLVKARGATAWEVFFLIRTGRGSDLENPSAEECEEVTHFLYEAAAYGIPVRTSEGPHFRRIYQQRKAGFPASRGELYQHLSRRLVELEGEPKDTPKLRVNATGDGRGIIFVAHDGETFPSGFLPLSVGNVKNQSLKEIYTKNSLMIGLRDPSKLKGRCGQCDYKVVCGGSRSRAWAEFFDPYEEDPACSYQPCL